jgi:hypothetical protein
VVDLAGHRRRAEPIGDVSRSVAVGEVATSMIRPSNWALRWDWSLATDDMSTVTVPPVTVVDPDTVELRPTAVVCWPIRTSSTR